MSDPAERNPAFDPTRVIDIETVVIPRWRCRLTFRHRGHVVSLRLGEVVWMCDNCGEVVR